MKKTKLKKPMPLKPEDMKMRLGAPTLKAAKGGKIAKVGKYSEGGGVKKAGSDKKGLYEVDTKKSFGENWADNTLTGRAFKGAMNALGIRKKSK